MAILLALCAALFWGLADFMGGSLSRRHPLLAVLLVSQAVGMAGIVVVAFVRTANPSAAVVLGGLDTTANAAFALAATEGFLSIVSVLGSLFPVVTVALAHVHLHERLARGQRLGVVLALAGTLAIAGG